MHFVTTHISLLTNNSLLHFLHSIIRPFTVIELIQSLRHAHVIYHHQDAQEYQGNPKGLLGPGPKGLRIPPPTYDIVPK